jgi:hypothetical protein
MPSHIKYLQLSCGSLVRKTAEKMVPGSTSSLFEVRLLNSISLAEAIYSIYQVINIQQLIVSHSYSEFVIHCKPQCCGSRMFIPNPGSGHFVPSQIPDLGSRILHKKEWYKINLSFSCLIR